MSVEKGLGDTEVIEDTWLEALIEHAQRQEGGV